MMMMRGNVSSLGRPAAVLSMPNEKM